MEHPDIGDTLAVGCICAGILEGDELAAVQREKRLKNRQLRKMRFMKKKWRPFDGDSSIMTCRHQEKFIAINSIYAKEGYRGEIVGYELLVDGEKVRPNDGEYYSSFETAVDAAFEKADPPLYLE